jgi:hypothetical protein
VSPAEHYARADELMAEVYREMNPPAPGLTLDGWALAYESADRLTRQAHVHALLATATTGGSRVPT